MRRDEEGRVEKLYYRIGEAALQVGVKPHVLRHWETEFSTIRPRKSKSGQRIYTKDQIAILHKVRTLLRDQRFTIEGAKRALRTGAIEALSPPVPAVALEPEPISLPALPIASPLSPPRDLYLRAALVDLRDEATALLRRLDEA